LEHSQVPIISTTIGAGRAINKFRWDRKEGRRVALGSSDGRLYVYDIGDTAVARESEWTDLQRTIGNLNATVATGAADGLNEQYTRSVYR
jgi:dynein intermediate chain, cytosolic